MAQEHSHHLGVRYLGANGVLQRSLIPVVTRIEHELAIRTCEQPLHACPIAAANCLL
jgi:hypothetical protein